MVYLAVVEVTFVVAVVMVDAVADAWVVDQADAVFKAAFQLECSFHGFATGAIRVRSQVRSIAGEHGNVVP